MVGFMGRNTTVLVIDDSAVWRKIIRKRLKDLGFIIVGEAADGQDGVGKYISLKPDLVTMDIEMPTMDGLAATKRILEIDPCARIIIVSSKGDESTVRKALLIGAIDFIGKASISKVWDSKLKKYVKKAGYSQTFKKIAGYIKDIKPAKLLAMIVSKYSARRKKDGYGD
jgi:two-component system chemotaxis response regulator CheY